jgi:hypothetical protein
MNFDIVPVIDVVLEHQEVIVTSSREVSSLLWKITESVNEYGVFKKERLFPTQLAFRSNPGYSLIDVFNLVVPATYIARVWNCSCVEFLATSLEEHYKNLNSVVKLEEYIKPPYVTLDNFEHVSYTWILKKMNSLVRDSIDYPDVLENPDTGENNLKIAQTTLAKLRFLKPGDSFVSDKVIIAWIDLLENKYIPALERKQARLSALKQSVDQASEALELKLESFHDDQKLFKSGKMSSPELIDKLLKLLAYITEYNEGVSMVAAEIEENQKLSLMQKIALMTPPEK